MFVFVVIDIALQQTGSFFFFDLMHVSCRFSEFRCSCNVQMAFCCLLLSLIVQQGREMEDSSSMLLFYFCAFATFAVSVNFMQNYSCVQFESHVELTFISSFSPQSHAVF